MYNLNHAQYILVTDTKNKQLSKPMKYFKSLSLMQNTQKEMIRNDRGRLGSVSPRR